MKNSLFTMLMLLCLLAAPSRARAAETSTPVHPWDVFELGLTAQTDRAGGYTESLPDSGAPYAEVTFTGTGGDAQGKSLTVRAFWDGGRNWKARFAPPAAGQWRYTSKSADPGLNAQAGTLTAAAWSADEIKANPARHGFVRVAATGARAGHYFVYADGTPFLWIGDTWWDWSKPGIHFETFQKLADDRAAKGFSVGQLRFNSPAMLGQGSTRPGLDEIRRIEKMIAYANSRGLTVWINPWWGGEALARTGPEKLRRWWRYTLDRLGAYNVVWVLACEYNMDNYSGLGVKFWEDLGAMVRKEDPYGHLVSAHPTPPSWDRGFAAPQWSTAEVPEMHAVLDFDQSQSGHGRWMNEMIPSVVSVAYGKAPARPIVVTEPWYEFIEGSAAAEDIRLGAWGAVLSGAAGHSYGGGHVWWAHTPESPSTQRPWPLEQGFEKTTYDYPGAVSLGVMARFLRSIDWWTLAPHPELEDDTPSKFCAAAPGKEYVVYLRYGGMVNLDLRPSAEGDKFEFSWLDPASGKQSRGGEVAGGAVRRFTAPGGYPSKLETKDWVLWVRVKK